VAQRVVLHVGVMKSGTSYLQRLLVANLALLAERGFLFPGGRWGVQVQAVSDVLQRKRVMIQPKPGAWQALVDELGAWDGTGIVSMEYLAPATAARIEEVVSSFPAGSVQVVVTARDLGRSVPAMWQETLKNGRHQPFEEYVAEIGSRHDLGRRFWREQDVAAVCDRWGSAVGPDQVALVTVPPPGAPAAELWRRFATAIGVDPSGFEEPGAANESLGAASAEVLRRLNGQIEGMPYGRYARRVKHQLAKRVLGPRRALEPAVGFEPPPWLRKRSRAMVGRLQSSGVRVVGDLADLEPLAVPGIAPETVPVEDQLAAAVDAIEGLVRGGGSGEGD
jgi:hypothetical protein